MALDAVRALCLENPAGGGTQLDLNPTEMDPLQDAATAAGYFVNGPSVTKADKTTLIDRTSGGMRFADANVTQLLSNLVGASQAGATSHQALADLAHFMGAPADGWASGAVRQVTYNGPLVATETWFTSSTMTQTIFKRVFTYSGPLATQIVNTVYTAAGAVSRTCTQNFSYNGPLVTGETRTWA